MTKVKFKQSGNIFRIGIDGHAGYNPGNDIVCASCSTLAYTLLQCLLAEKENGAFLMFLQDIDEKSGHFYIKCKARQERAAQIGLIVNVIAAGFALVQQKHPEHVEVEYR